MTKPKAKVEEVTENKNSVESIEKSESKINETNSVTSEFGQRLFEALKKHAPEAGIENEKEANAFIRFIGINIGNQFPELSTAEVIEKVGEMLKGECQNEEMLTLIEDMPVGGYGY